MNIDQQGMLWHRFFSLGVPAKAFVLVAVFLAHREALPSIYAQQTLHLQDRIKASMDLRYRTMGLYGNIQH